MAGIVLKSVRFKRTYSEASLPKEALFGEPIYCKENNSLYIGQGLGMPIKKLSGGSNSEEFPCRIEYVTRQKISFSNIKKFTVIKENGKVKIITEFDGTLELLTPYRIILRDVPQVCEAIEENGIIKLNAVSVNDSVVLTSGYDAAMKPDPSKTNVTLVMDDVNLSNKYFSIFFEIDNMIYHKLDNKFIDTDTIATREYVDDNTTNRYAKQSILSTNIVDRGNDEYWVAEQIDHPLNAMLDTFIALTINGIRYSKFIKSNINSRSGNSLYYYANDHVDTTEFPLNISIYETPYVEIYDYDWNSLPSGSLTKIELVQYDYKNKVTNTQIEDIYFNQVTDIPSKINDLLNNSTEIPEYHITRKLMASNYFMSEDYENNFNQTPYADTGKNNTSTKTKWGKAFVVENKTSDGKLKGKGFKINFRQLDSKFATDSAIFNFGYTRDLLVVMVRPDGTTKDIVIDKYYTAEVIPNIQDGDYYFLFTKSSPYVVVSLKTMTLNLFNEEPIDVDRFVQHDNKRPYMPMDDYNPTTKKYVDDKFQPKTDSSLTTESKNVPGAINEIDEKKIEVVRDSLNLPGTVDNEYPNLNTKSKKLIGAINEVLDQSNTRDVELIDARIGVDGKTYANVGESVRGQVGQLKERVFSKTEFLDKSISAQIPYNINILNGNFETGLFSSITGRPQSDVNNAWIRTIDHYPANNTIDIVSIGKAKGIYMFCYDGNDNYIGSVKQVANSSQFNFIDGTSNVKFAFYGDDNFGIDLKNLGVPILTYGNAVESSLIKFNKLDSKIESNIDFIDNTKVNKSKIFEHSEPIIRGNGYWNSFGKIGDTVNAGHTDLFNVYGYEKIKVFTNINEAGYAIALFDKDKNILPSISILGSGKKEYNVDLIAKGYENVYYASVSYYDASQTYDGFYAISYNDNCLEKRISKVEEKIKRHYNTFSIIGDSYSSFEGYMVDSLANTWYPASSHGNDDTNDVENVEQTWWYKFANKYNSRLIENNSWSGSTISYDGYSAGTSDGKSASFITRADKFTTPELIIVFGGTNDAWVANDTGTTSTFLGEYKYSNWTDTDLEKFRPALAYLFNKIKRKNIGSTIIFVLNDGITTISESVETICEYYGVQLLKLSNIEKAHSHPTENGMDGICNQLIQFLS